MKLMRFLGVLYGILTISSISFVLYSGIHSKSAFGSPSTPWTIVVVAGQSNAEGTNSFISQIPQGQELGTHPADDSSYIWWEGADGAAPTSASDYFNTISNPGFTVSGWMHSQNTDPAMDRLIKVRDLDKPVPMGQRQGQFGPEIGIVRQLYDQGNRNIVVLKVSYGFQALAKANSQFIPYDWYPDIPGQPVRNKSYTHLMSAYSGLTSFLSNRGDTYHTGAVYWLQGETDTLDSGYTALFEENFDLLVNRLKIDLNLVQNGHIVIRKFNMRHCIDNAYPINSGNYCGMGYALSLEGASFSTILNSVTVNAIQSIPLNASRVRTVRGAIQTISDKYDWVDAVETDDQPFGNDFIHLSTASQLEIGKRMAAMADVP